jgi:hypothetical protein
MSVLADEAYAIAVLSIPWGNRDSGTVRSPAGAVVISPAGVTCCEATCATRRRSIRACRERWPERRRRRGAEGPAASAWAGVSTRRDGDRSWPGRPPRVKLVMVGDAHEVAIPRGLKVQTSEPDFEFGWKGGPICPWSTSGPCTRCRSPSRWLVEADLQRTPPYLARQLSVRKVVPTLTSKSAEIYLSMAGAKQLGDTGFILVPAGVVRPAVVCSRCSRHCIVLHHGACRGGATSEAGEEAGPTGPRVFILRRVPISW